MEYKLLPLYDFKCPKCNHEFEDLVENSKVNLVDCPNCKEIGCCRKIGFPIPVIQMPISSQFKEDIKTPGFTTRYPEYLDPKTGKRTLGKAEIVKNG